MIRDGPALRLEVSLIKFFKKMKKKIKVLLKFILSLKCVGYLFKYFKSDLSQNCNFIILNSLTQNSDFACDAAQTKRN